MRNSCPDRLIDSCDSGDMRSRRYTVIDQRSRVGRLPNGNLSVSSDQAFFRSRPQKRGKKERLIPPGGGESHEKGRGYSSYLLGVKKAILVPFWVFSLKRSTEGTFAVH